MADAQRRAEAVWEGSLAQGAGVVTLATSAAAPPLPVTWASRTARSEGKTSPEELIAAAHSSCYCMAFSAILTEGGTPPDKLEVSATVTFAQVEGGYKVQSSALDVKAKVPGLSAAAFAEAAEAARVGCPVSAALQGNVEISVTARLV
jgi:osmotically inducible protein OsmC